MSRVQASSQEWVSLSQVGCPGNWEGGPDRGEDPSVQFSRSVVFDSL